MFVQIPVIPASQTKIFNFRLVYPATIILVIHCATEVLKALSDVIECSGNEDMAQPLYRSGSIMQLCNLILTLYFFSAMVPMVYEISLILFHIYKL